MRTNVAALAAPIEIGYVERASPFAVTPTTPATAATVLSATVVADGGPLEVEFFAPGIYSDATNVQTTVSLWVDGVDLGARCAHFANIALVIFPALAKRRLALPAASHIVEIRAYRASATGNQSIQAGPGGAGTYLPAYLRVSRVLRG